MRKADRYATVLERLSKIHGEADTELDFETPFQLLVAVVLSAQCTDRRVNMVTPALFAAYPIAELMAKASEEDLLRHVASVSYPNNKARHLVALSRMLVSDFDGTVPETMDELVRLPGVGRKTANVMLATVFGQSAMAVDTHVFRVSHRLSLVSASATTPLAVERQLLRNIPAEVAAPAHLWLLLHGRYTCTARNPHCTECPLADICPSKDKTDAKTTIKHPKRTTKKQTIR